MWLHTGPKQTKKLLCLTNEALTIIFIALTT